MEKLAIASLFCDGNSGYGAIQCSNVGSCPGATNGNCYPNHLWSGTTGSSSGIYKLAQLVSGSLSLTGACNTGECTYTITGSVRCVLGFEANFKISKPKKTAV